jgi:KEOPS complex subunit Pcc1
VTHRALIERSFDTRERANTIQQALALELGAIDGERSQTVLDREAETLRITIAAEDATALRAAKHSWFSLLVAAERTADSVARGE